MALHLPRQPLIPGHIKETRMAPVGEQHVLAAAVMGPPAGPPAAVLIDPRSATGASGWASIRSTRSANASCITGQEQAALAGGPGHRTLVLSDQRRRMPAQPRGDPAARRDARQRLGEALARA